MNREAVDISAFEASKEFYGRFELLLTIKSFELGNIRKRYIESKKKNKSGRSGSVTRRKVTTGGVAKVVIEKGKIVEAKVISELNEPRGIAIHENKLSVSSENEVYIIDNHGELQLLSNPWFSYIHTVDFSVDGSKLLISSSGFDVLMEYNIKKEEKLWEWFAWENGFDTGRDPETGEKIILSRTKIENDHPKVMVIDDPVNQKLPTAMRAAFINSALYDNENPQKILATLFHEGAVYRIDKQTGVAEKLIGDLKNPHGGRRAEGILMVTSTAGGEVIVRNGKGEKSYDFRNIQGKQQGLEGLEWLQNSVASEGNIITIDSNRTSFVVFNPEEKKIDRIPYNSDWAVQDMIEGSINEYQEKVLKQLSQSST